jgi:multiple sugar transport system ATP-binding protein
MATISLEQVKKVYPNGFEAVHEMDLKVSDGEFMVLVGPSGCGKTTVLRMVAGLEKISGGTLRIGTRVVNDLGPRERNIAMVFQNYAAYPHMTVRENIGFALRLRRLPKELTDAKVTQVARALGLAGCADRKPGQLSGGQRQRVAMGRAIVRNPSALLMDEPLSNLDAKLRVEMRAEVSRIQDRLAVATMYVTHDQVEAMTMGDRVAVMRSGSVLQCDAPQALYDHPNTLFVAAFIGSPSMNMYEAVVQPGAAVLRLGSQEIVLPGRVGVAHPGLARHAGRKVVVGFRPEHLRAAARGDEAVIEGSVDLVEALGSESLVHFSIDAQRVTTETVSEEEQVTDRGAGVARVDPRTSMKLWEWVRFAVDVDRMQFFDPESEQAIWD